MHTTKIKFDPLAKFLKKGGVVPSINDGNHRWTHKQADKPKDERYAESIIRDQACNYDAIEIHGARDVGDPGRPDSTSCEVDDEDPQFFSVYVHLKEGGVECVGDHETRELAKDYASELSAKYGFLVYDFSPEKKVARAPKKVAKSLGMGM